MKIGTSLDAQTKSLTLFLWGFVVFVLTLVTWLSWEQAAARWVLGTDVIVLVLLGATPFLQPIYLSVDHHGVHIRLRVGAFYRVVAGEITDVRTTESGVVWLRLFGSGGFHGYLGYFRGEKTYLFWATRQDNLFVVERKDRVPVVVSVDDPEQFRRALAEAGLPVP